MSTWSTSKSRKPAPCVAISIPTGNLYKNINESIIPKHGHKDLKGGLKDKNDVFLYEGKILKRADFSYTRSILLLYNLLFKYCTKESKAILVK